MFTELFVAIFLGVLFGIFTGLTPGIHVNLIALITVSLSAYLLGFFSLLALGAFIIALAITHSFLDSLPSVYLGAPDASQELLALPGHKLLLRGEGHNAILYTLIGSLGSLLLAVILFPVFAVSMSFLEPLIGDYTGVILLCLMIFMIAKDKEKWMRSLLMFLLSGVLGIIVLTTANLNQPLFPLLSGLFGISLLLLSLKDNTTIPQQDITKPSTITTKKVAKTTTTSTGVGFCAAFLPGFGSSQAAIVATYIVGDVGDEGFLTLVGGINTANMLVSIATVYVLDKARNGAILAVREIIGAVRRYDALVFLCVALVAGGVAVLLALRISKIFSKFITRVDYEFIVLSIIGFITVLTVFFDGLFGLMILITATGLGVLANQVHVGKNHLMGCLILPVILFFLL